MSAVLMTALAGGCAAAVKANGGSDTMGARGEPSKTWYFAEGTTRAGFTEYVCLLNPSDAVSIARFSYMLSTGETIERRYDLLPGSRTTVNVGNEVPAGSDVSIKVDASEPVVAERPMYFNYKGAWSGGHDVLGATAPASEWYFAEGTTRDGFDTYLCLQNPGDDEASVDIEYFLGDGTTQQRKDVKIAPRSRFTVATHGDGLGIGRHSDARGDFSLRVTAATRTPIIAERASYFSYKPYLNGGHDVLGAREAREEWFFAEGCTRPGFDTYVCIANPGAEGAEVDVTYFCGDGQVVEHRGISVPARSRFTIAAHEDGLGVGRHDGPRGDFSTKVRSTNEVPVVAERASYFFYRPFWSGGHDVVGAAAPAERWYFAEGCTRQGFDTYLCLANPNDGRAVVNVTYYRGDNQTEEKSGIEIPGRSRLTIPVHEGGRGIGRRDDASGDVSIKVTCDGAGVVAERPMYFAERWRTMDRRAIAGAWGWGDISHGNTARPQVALTFDCENAGLTGQLLDVLKQRDVKATCFLLNNVASSRRDLIVRMADEGHEIGNHGVTHSQFTKISAQQVVSELAGPEAVVAGTTGYTTKPYFRFPYGERNAGLVQQVNSLGYLSVYWSVDPQEWRGSATPEGVASNVLGTSGPGAIVLMHDGPKTIAALPTIIDGLRARGFTLVTLTELLYPGP